MNERIKELAEQANLITHKVPNGLAHLHTLGDIEEFAELIVRECAMVVNNIDSDSYDGTLALALAENKIRHHFGVKQ